MTTQEAITALRKDDPLASSASEAEPREKTPWLIGFFCLVISLLPTYVIPPGPLKGNGAPARAIAILLFGLTVLGFVLLRRTARNRTVRLGAVILLLYFFVLLVVYGVGLTHIETAAIEASKTRSIIGLVAYVGAALYMMTTIRTVRRRTIALGCLATTLTFSCLVAVLQGTTKIDLHLLFSPPGFVVNIADQGRGGTVTLADRHGAVRAYGTAWGPIEFSVLAAATVPLTMHFARFAANRGVRLLAALACLVALLAVPASVSRSGVVSLVAALLFYMFAHKVRHIATMVVAGSAAVFGYVLAFPHVANAMWFTITNAAEDDSVIDRTADYAQVSQTFHKFPIFGLGLGGSPPAEYGFLDNQWLQAIVQGGIVGGAAMIILSLGALFGISAGLRTATSPRERDQVYAMGAMIIAILVSSFTFDLFAFEQVTLTFFVLFGLLWSQFTVRWPASNAG